MPQELPRSLRGNQLVPIVTCFYCDANMSELKQEFVIHPYIPRDLLGRPIYFCLKCADSWKKHRDIAASKNLLVSTDDHESICGLCSTYLDKLKHCSKCQRSFCVDCIGKLSQPNLDYDTIQSCDWLCMCCTLNIYMTAPLPKMSWKKINLESLQRPVNISVGTLKTQCCSKDSRANNATMTQNTSAKHDATNSRRTSRQSSIIEDEESGAPSCKMPFDEAKISTSTSHTTARLTTMISPTSLLYENNSSIDTKSSVVHVSTNETFDEKPHHDLSTDLTVAVTRAEKTWDPSDMNSNKLNSKASTSKEDSENSVHVSKLEFINEAEIVNTLTKIEMRTSTRRSSVPKLEHQSNFVPPTSATKRSRQVGESTKFDEIRQYGVDSQVGESTKFDETRHYGVDSISKPRETSSNSLSAEYTANVQSPPQKRKATSTVNTTTTSIVITRSNSKVVPSKPQGDSLSMHNDTKSTKPNTSIASSTKSISRDDTQEVATLIATQSCPQKKMMTSTCNEIVTNKSKTISSGPNEDLKSAPTTQTERSSIAYKNGSFSSKESNALNIEKTTNTQQATTNVDTQPLSQKRKATSTVNTTTTSIVITRSNSKVVPSKPQGDSLSMHSDAKSTKPNTSIASSTKSISREDTQSAEADKISRGKMNMNLGGNSFQNINRVATTSTEVSYKYDNSKRRFTSMNNNFPDNNSERCSSPELSRKKSRLGTETTQPIDVTVHSIDKISLDRNKAKSAFSGAQTIVAKNTTCTLRSQTRLLDTAQNASNHLPSSAIITKCSNTNTSNTTGILTHDTQTIRVQQPEISSNTSNTEQEDEESHASEVQKPRFRYRRSRRIHNLANKLWMERHSVIIEPSEPNRTKLRHSFRLKSSKNHLVYDFKPVREPLFRIRAPNGRYLVCKKTNDTEIKRKRKPSSDLVISYPTKHWKVYNKNRNNKGRYCTAEQSGANSIDSNEISSRTRQKRGKN